MEAFRQILQTSANFRDARLPEKAWNLLFKQQPQGVNLMEDGADGVR